MGVDHFQKKKRRNIIFGQPGFDPYPPVPQYEHAVSINKRTIGLSHVYIYLRRITQHFLLLSGDVDQMSGSLKLEHRWNSDILVKPCHFYEVL